MYLRPCMNRCSKRVGCDKYKEVLGRLKGVVGSGITSVKVKCDDFLKIFQPGDRVTALLSRRFEHAEYDIDGTVTCVKEDKDAGKLVIYLDEEAFEDSTNNFIRLWPKHVKLLDEPRLKVCECCGIPEGKKNSERFSCYACEHDGNDGSL